MRYSNYVNMDQMNARLDAEPFVEVDRFKDFVGSGSGWRMIDVV